MKVMNSHAGEKFCLLLTAVIDPQGMSLTRRSDPKLREADYIGVIRSVAVSTDIPIVFYENSGYDLVQVKATLESCAPGRNEVISDNGNAGFSKSLGKGYGELLIILHALGKSSLLRTADYLVKLTGRYDVSNLKEVLAGLDGQGEFFVASENLPGERYAYSGFFVCKPEFIRSYLAPLLETIDDSRQHPFEEALRRAIGAAVRDDHRCVAFPVKPAIVGISGTWNVRLDPDRYNALVFSLPKLKSTIRNYGHSAKRRLFHLLGISSTIERS